MVISSTPRVQTNLDNHLDPNSSLKQMNILNIQIQPMHISCYSLQSFTSWLLFFKPILSIPHFHMPLFLYLYHFLYLRCSACCFFNLGKLSISPNLCMPFLCILSFGLLFGRISFPFSQSNCIFCPMSFSKSYILIIVFYV